MKLIEDCRRSYGMGSNPNGGVKLVVTLTYEEAEKIGMGVTRFRWEGERELSIYANITQHVEGRPVEGRDNPVYVAARAALGI